MSLIFLDTETTGLDPARHEVWEIAYAIGQGPIETRILPHSIDTAEPKALELNGYLQRGFNVPAHFWADVELKSVLAGATIVGSNPAFDTAFLRARWGIAPWHHRLIAVESMAFGIFGYEKPKGLADVASDLRERGYSIPVPDHTAAGDVATLRLVFHSLRTEAANPLPVR